MWPRAICMLYRDCDIKELQLNQKKEFRIVHDVDLKERRIRGRGGRRSARPIAGLCAAHKEDDVRLARGVARF